MDDFKLLNSATKQTYGDFNDLDFLLADLAVISGNERATQAVIKNLLTQVGANPLFPNYGSNLQSLANSNLQDIVARTNIKNTILSALAYQSTIEESTDPSEQLAGVDDMRLSNFTRDGRTGFLVEMVIPVKDGNKLTVNVGG